MRKPGSFWRRGGKRKSSTKRRQAGSRVRRNLSSSRGPSRMRRRTSIPEVKDIGPRSSCLTQLRQLSTRPSKLVTRHNSGRTRTAGMGHKGQPQRSQPPLCQPLHLRHHHLLSHRLTRPELWERRTRHPQEKRPFSASSVAKKAMLQSFARTNQSNLLFLKVQVS